MATEEVHYAVVLVSSRADDHAALRKIFRDSPWELHGAFTGSDGLGLIYRNHENIFVVICEHTLPDADWKFLLAPIENLPVRPRLIVASRLADERLWAEVLNLGASDLLLSDPFVPEEVLHVIQSAWLAWNRPARPAAVRRMGPGPVRSLANTGPRALTAGSHN